MDHYPGSGHDQPSADEIPTAPLPALRPTGDPSLQPTLRVRAVTPIPTPPASPGRAPEPPAPPTGSGALGALRRFNDWLLGLFVTNPSSGRSLGYIDGLRALAALGVVFLHLHSEDQPSTFLLPIPFTGMTLNFQAIIVSGGIGVYLFFILSGFLLAQPWIEANYRAEAAPGLKRYALLRVTRIAPPFYLTLFIVLVFFTPSLVPNNLVYSKAGLFSVVAHLFFAQFLFPVSSASFRIGGQFWSLTTEMMFYVMLPIVVRAFYRRRWLVALPLGALISFGYLTVFPSLLPVLTPRILRFSAALGAKWYTASDVYFYIHDQFPAHAFEFALGITLANLYVASRLGRLSTSRILSALTSRVAGTSMFIAGCLITLSAIFIANPALPLLSATGTTTSRASSFLGLAGLHTFNVYFEMTVSVGFALILAGASHGGSMIRGALSFTPLRIIGIVSYTIYLLHLPLLHNILHIYRVKDFTPNALFVNYALTLFAQMLPISIFLYLVVERPLMRWARQRGRASASPPRPAPAMPAEPGGPIWRGRRPATMS